jgi:negative regulator of flagellin synthesis FlgM
LSYTTGIGSQQFPGAAETLAASSANRTAKAEQNVASVSSPDTSSKALPVDQANLSTTASVVAQALSGSDVRFEKVAELQQSIAAGTYNIPASDVASKVLSALLH